MDLTDALQVAGGAMRASTALAQGFSDHTVRKCVQAGLVTRPRRGWLALPTLHPIDAEVHRRRPIKLRAPGQLLDHLENSLDCVAACLPHEEALTIWDSALQKGLTDYPALAALPLRGRARALLADCTPFSDSGLESIFRTRLRWLKISIRPQAWVHGHRVDFLLGDRLIVQVDGKQHEGAQRTSDCEHDAELMKRGY